MKINIGKDTRKLISDYFTSFLFDLDWHHPGVKNPKGLATWLMYSNKQYYKLPYDIGHAPNVDYFKYNADNAKNHCRVGITKKGGICKRDRGYLASYYESYGRERPAEALTVKNTNKCVIMVSNNKTELDVVGLLEEMLIRDLDPPYNIQTPTKLMELDLYNQIVGRVGGESVGFFK